MIKVALQSGSLSFGARPKLEVFEALQHQFTTVVCLQTHREDLEMLERKVRQTSLNWVHIPLMCASRFLLRDLPSFEAFRAGIQQTAELLSNGSQVFVHCAGGVHRTGVFVKTLLMVLGKTAAESEGIMGDIRDITIQKCGLHRLELAEELAQMILSRTAPAESETGWGEMRMTELLSAKENPLLWAKFSPRLPSIVQVELFATDFGLSKVVEGFKVQFELDHSHINTALGFNWSASRAPVTEDLGRVRSLSEASDLIESFCSSTFSKTPFKFAGTDAHLDLQFTMHFMKPVATLAHYRVVDLSSLSSYLNTPASQGSLLRDLETLQAIKLKFFT